MGNKLLSCFASGDEKIFNSSIQSCLQGELNQPTDYRIVHKDNQVEWYSILFSQIEDEDGDSQILCNVRNITAKKNYEKSLEYFGMHDQLTGVYNRAYLNGELARQSRNNNYPITILSFDLDNLKQANDSYGHITGDKLLVDCASLVSNSLRKGDILARVGGDEFAVILPSTSQEEARVIVERIEQSLADYNKSNKILKLSISIGMATAKDASDPLELLLVESDRRMYDKKKEKKRRLRKIDL